MDTVVMDIQDARRLLRALREGDTQTTLAKRLKYLQKIGSLDAYTRLDDMVRAYTRWENEIDDLKSRLS